MKYYEGIQLIKYPWIQWQEVAEFETTEAFEASDWADNPLVKAKSDIVQVFGAYAYRIVDGEFVDRTEAELAEQESEYVIKNALLSDRNRLQSINDNSFTYDSNEFPMDEVSRLFYETMAKLEPISSKIRTMENTEYALEAANIPAFINEYYKKLLNITKHTL
jgi:hypothetical protein